MFLSGKYLFGNAAFQINAMIIHTVEFVVAVQEVSPFYNFMHTTWQIIDMSIQQYWGRGGMGRGSPTELAQVVVPEKASPLRTGCRVGKHSYENFYLASVLNGFKKFCIWRMEILIYLLKILLFEIKIIW